MKLGIIFIIIWVVLILILSSEVIPDLTGDGSYEPCQTSGHPLWTDC